jgi:hypothetical protein
MTVITAGAQPMRNQPTCCDQVSEKITLEHRWAAERPSSFHPIGRRRRDLTNLGHYRVSGSDQTITCSTTDGSRQIVCAKGVGDFKINEGVELAHVGFYSSLKPVTNISLTVNGMLGSTAYSYALCTADPWRGFVGGGCAQARVSNGPATLTLRDSITVRYVPSGINAALGLLYRRTNRGPWRFVSSVFSPFYDIGWTPNTSEGWPPSPTFQAVKQHFWSRITAVHGNTITTQDPVPTTAVNVTVRHDDTEAMQAWINAAALERAKVRLGPGTYRIDEPTAWSYVHQKFYHTFTPKTPGYPSLFAEGMLHLFSNSTLIGAGPPRTTLVTDFVGHIGGGNGTFGLNTGSHNNPFTLTPPLRAFRLKQAQPGISVVTLQNPGEADAFSSGDEVFIWGGASVAGDYYASQIRQVVSSARLSGMLTLDEPLEKPVPEGTPGAPPSIGKLKGQIVTNITIAGMTIDNYNNILQNTSAVDHIHIADVDAPWWSISDLWHGGFSRDWKMERCKFVSAQNEFDLQDDVTFSQGTWRASGCLCATEGSSNVHLIKSVLDLGERYCLGGATCTPLLGLGSIAAHQSVSGFQLIDNKITSMAALSNAIEGQPALSIQGGPIPGYVPSRDIIQDNVIVTNRKEGIVAAGPVNGLRITGNRLNFVLAAAPFVGIDVSNGMISGNQVLVDAPGSEKNYSAIILEPSSADLPLSVLNNKIRASQAQSYIGIYLKNQAIPQTATISLENNTFHNLAKGILAPGLSKRDNLVVRHNVMLSVAVPYEFAPVE